MMLTTHFGRPSPTPPPQQRGPPIRSAHCPAPTRLAHRNLAVQFAPLPDIAHRQTIPFSEIQVVHALARKMVSCQFPAMPTASSPLLRQTEPYHLGQLCKPNKYFPHNPF